MPPKPTKRERKDEAKRRRLDEMKRRQRRARMRKLYTWGTVAAVLALIVVGIGLSRASNNRAKNKIKLLATAAGCDLAKEFPEEGSQHVGSTPPPTYRTNPPTSGNHFNSPLRTGIYPTPTPDGGVVHNLEHGHVAIWYLDGQLDRPYLEALAEVVRGNPTRVLLAPRPTMSNEYKIAFTSWGLMQGCKSPTNPPAVAALAQEFVRQHVGKGPEGDRPGQAGTTTLPPASPTTSPRPTGTASPRPTGTASPRPTGSPT